MPKIVATLTFMSMIISCSVKLSMKSFIASAPGLPPPPQTIFNGWG